MASADFCRRFPTRCRACSPRGTRRQTSPDKSDVLRPTLAAFTSAPSGQGSGFTVSGRLTQAQRPDAVRVPRVGASPPASFPPSLAAAQLPSDSGSSCQVQRGLPPHEHRPCWAYQKKAPTRSSAGLGSFSLQEVAAIIGRFDQRGREARLRSRDASASFTRKRSLISPMYSSMVMSWALGTPRISPISLVSARFRVNASECC